MAVASVVLLRLDPGDAASLDLESFHETNEVAPGFSVLRVERFIGLRCPAAGRELMVTLIESLSAGVPRLLVEIAKLGRTLSKRAADILACFDRPGTSNGPTDAIERSPGAPARLRPRIPQPHQLHHPSLLETDGFRPDYTLHW